MFRRCFGVVCEALPRSRFSLRPIESARRAAAGSSTTQSLIELANTQSLIKAKEKQRDSFMEKLETATDPEKAVVYAEARKELSAELLILRAREDRLLPSAAP